VLRQQQTEESDLLEEREGVEIRKDRMNIQTFESEGVPGGVGRVEIFVEEEKVIFTPQGDRNDGYIGV
jgi:hypothetical protein